MKETAYLVVIGLLFIACATAGIQLSNQDAEIYNLERENKVLSADLETASSHYEYQEYLAYEDGIEDAILDLMIRADVCIKSKEIDMLKAQLVMWKYGSVDYFIPFYLSHYEWSLFELRDLMTEKPADYLDYDYNCQLNVSYGYVDDNFIYHVVNIPTPGEETEM